MFELEGKGEEGIMFNLGIHSCLSSVPKGIGFTTVGCTTVGDVGCSLLTSRLCFGVFKVFSFPDFTCAGLDDLGDSDDLGAFALGTGLQGLKHKKPHV